MTTSLTSAVELARQEIADAAEHKTYRGTAWSTEERMGRAWLRAPVLAEALLSLHAALPTAEEREALAFAKEMVGRMWGLDDNPNARVVALAIGALDRLLAVGEGR